MNNFAAFFALEWRRFYKSKNIIIFLVLWILLCFSTIIGINEYSDLVNRELQFQKIESLNFKKFPNYDTYGDEGVSVQYCPGPTGIFFRNIGVSTELIGKFDSIVNISIFDNYKSRSLFRGLYAGIWSFAGIFFVFVSLMCLSWAVELLSAVEFNKFLSTLLSPWKVFFFSVVSRLVLLTLILFFTFLTMYMLILAYDIQFSSVDLIYITDYAVTTLLMLFFFFFIGLIIGIIRAQTGGVLAIMVIWALFVFLFPGLIHYIVEQNTFGSIRDYQTEIEKMEILLNFEKRCFDEAGKYDKNKYHRFKEFAENYWKDEYGKIEKLENKLKNDLKIGIDMFNNLSLLTPSTFYYLTSIEVSSRGYENFLYFYTYILNLKRNFVRFYIDRYYYHNPKKMVNFIKDKENLYFAHSQLPNVFGTGILISFIIPFVLFFISYFLFKRYIYRIDIKDLDRFLNQDFHLKKGQVKVMEIENKNFKNLLYNLLSGKIETKRIQQFPGKLVLNGDTILSSGGRTDFIFLPDPHSIPGNIRVKDFLIFIASLKKISLKKRVDLLNNKFIKSITGTKFKKLTTYQKARVLIELAGLIKTPFYFFFDTAVDQTADFAILFKEKLETIKKEAIVLYLTTNDYVRTTKVQKGKPFLENTAWLDHLEYVKYMQE